MPRLDTSAISDRLQGLVDKLPEDKTTLAAAGAAIVVGGALVWRACSGSSGYKKKPSVFELSGGSIERGEVKKEWDNYEASFGKEAGAGITDRSKTTQLVDVFYSLVTDIYEWGWGQSFHFSPKLNGKNWACSEAAHEARVAVALGLKPGMKCLDVGCGVGGPMRTIAAVSGAHITGITINQYQVDRATAHNARLGLAPLTEVVRGNFLEMPFQPATFDAAYAIEATCHAAKLEEVFSEIARVLKPGGMFVSYEWVSTEAFDAANPDHVKIIDEINFGNGLPEMRTFKQAEDAGRMAGMELVGSLDLAVASAGAGPWYGRLEELEWQNRLSHAVVTAVDAVYLAPKGLKQVHNMLVEVSRSLVAGGRTGVFSPMHMLVFRKNGYTARERGSQGPRRALPRRRRRAAARAAADEALAARRRVREELARAGAPGGIVGDRADVTRARAGNERAVKQQVAERAPRAREAARRGGGGRRGRGAGGAAGGGGLRGGGGGLLLQLLHAHLGGAAECLAAAMTSTAAAAEGAAAAAGAGAYPTAAAAAFAAAAPPAPPPYAEGPDLDAHVARSWAYFRALGAPAWHVAPMVDASELPFRMLCRAHGATAAYTPMLHAKLFVTHKTYRAEHFTTCAGDRPLFAQFCANDPATLVKAAEGVQDHCDWVDLNLGCPQRIAKKGYYGAFLMDDLDLVQRMVSTAAASLRVPVSCKIRLFPDLEKTVAYARMLQAAGCSLLGIHGRTRDMKDTTANRANWDAIRAVRAAVRIPVIANGDVRCLDDARRLMAHTGADGVMSAEPLLYYPALFDPQLQVPIMKGAAEDAAAAAAGAAAEAAAGPSGQQQQQQQQQGEGEGAPGGAAPAPHPSALSPAAEPSATAHLDRLRLCREYAEANAAHPAHPRMVKGHVHKLVQGWLAEFTDLRERLNGGGCSSPEKLLALVGELEARVAAAGRPHPVPRPCDRKQLQAARDAARRAAVEEQEREAAALAAVDAEAAAAPGGGQQQQAPRAAEEEPAAKRPCTAMVAAVVLPRPRALADGRRGKRGGGAVATERPIIGILTQPGEPAPRGSSYIAASYVKFGVINGLLLPGGGAKLSPGHPFYDAASLLVNLAIKVRAPRG
ncbi:MAG: dihydrouridine synthase-domain-containing protein [Monoraphidium minutum]|nr:MAG: dihydrouridine synthase-domain-containing protein [Monoraphidium minutum]